MSNKSVCAIEKSSGKINVTGCIVSTGELDIPFSSSYVVGSTIPTNPALVMGTPMINGQSCGNEGVNVYVNTLMNQNPTSTYKGCYKDDINTPTMTVIGGSPSPSIAIQNGNFSQPQITNNSYQYFDLYYLIPIVMHIVRKKKKKLLNNILLTNTHI